jgi:polyhydroxybutyrate depolymerase
MRRRLRQPFHLACAAGLTMATGCDDARNALEDAATSADTGAQADVNRRDAAPSAPAAPLGHDAGPTTTQAGDASAMTTDAAAATDAGTIPPRLASCLPTASLRPGKSTFTLMRDGTARSVNVYVPSMYDGKTPLPLVVDFHGLHEGAALHESVSNWDDAVDANQYIVAMPQGIQNAWNVGPCCTESRTVDDVAFARELVARVASDGCVDSRRIYGTGYSNGGGMSWKVACDAADLFAAVAPAAFDMMAEMTCTPSRPISVFAFRGTSDPIVPYAGGASTPPTLYALNEIHFLGARTNFERWGMLNQCSGTSVSTGEGCTTYTECAAGVRVTLCTKEGGGHDPSDASLAWPMLASFKLP